MAYVPGIDELKTEIQKTLPPEEPDMTWLKEKEEWTPPGTDVLVNMLSAVIPGVAEVKRTEKGAIIPDVPAPDAISQNVGLGDPADLLTTFAPMGLAAGAALSGIKKVDRALPSPAGLTSKLEDVIRQKMGGKATAQEIGAMVKQAGVKQEELEDIGLEQWLQGLENQLFEKQRMSSLEPSTSVQTPKIQKEEVLGYLRAERPELKTISYPHPKAKEALEHYKKEMDRAAAQVDAEYAALIKKYKLYSNKDVGFKESDLHRHLTDARFMAQQGSSFKENSSLQLLTLGIDRDQEEIISDVERLAKHQLAYENANEKYNFISRNSDRPRWERYSLSNQGIGENYREYVFTAPFTDRARNREIFRSEGHWPNVDDPVYHIRAQDLTDKDGDKLLNVDEIQSDIHQYGQKFGYKKRGMTENEKEILFNVLRENDLLPRDFLVGESEEYGPQLNTKLLLEKAMYLPDEEFAKLQPIFKEAGLAVDLPYKKSWHEQAMRRMIKEALDSGKDGVSWTAGSVQAKRAGQDLGKVTRIRYLPKYSTLVAYQNEEIIFERTVPLQKLSQYVGSDISKQIKEGVSKSIADRKAWIEAQKKRDDAAIEKYRVWLKNAFGQAGSENPPLIEATLKSNLSILNDFNIEPESLAKVRNQMEKAGLTENEIFDLRNKTINYPPRMERIEVPATAESFGGSGMKKFYDEKVVNFARQEAKRLGGTVTQTTVKSSTGEEVPIWKFKFGPKTKELSEEKGFPLYAAPPIAVGVGEVVRQYKKEQEQKKEY